MIGARNENVLEPERYLNRYDTRIFVFKINYVVTRQHDFFLYINRFADLF